MTKVMRGVDAVGRSLQEEWWIYTGTRPWKPRAMVSTLAAYIAVMVVLLATGLIGVVLSLMVAALIVLAPFVLIDEAVRAVRRRRRRRRQFEASWPVLERIPGEDRHEH